MKKGKKRYTKKAVYKSACNAFILVIFVVAIGYGILHSEWLKPRINELSASYISLNNTETTDILKITNLKKQTDQRGKSFRNKSMKKFQMTGERNTIYQIVLYHIGEEIEEEYVKYYLTNEMGIELEGVLNQQEETSDGGRVLFTGTMKDGQNWSLKIWVDKEYDKNINNVSYEIRIKQVR